MYFVGVVVGSFTLPRLGDLYGRKRMAVIGNSVHVIAGTIVLISKSYTLTVAMYFWLGYALAGKSFVGFAYLSETVRAEDLPWLTSVIFMAESLTLLSTAFWFKFISKHWQFIYGFPLAIHAIMTFWMAFQFDGPKYDFGKGNYALARSKLTKIGKKNGILGPNDEYTKTFLKEHEEYSSSIAGEVKDKVSAKAFFKNKLNRCNLLIYMLIAVGTSFTFYMINFYVKYLPGDIYIN